MNAVLVAVTTDADAAICEAMRVEYADGATAEYVARSGETERTTRSGIEAHNVYLELGR